MAIQLIFSIVLGFLIGLERESAGKDIGIRTTSLITLGSTLFTLISANLTGDPTRIVGQIVTGVGFIGAGLIFKEENHTHGLTTATTIWCAAAIGALIGFEMYNIAFMGMVCIIVINQLFQYLKR